MNTSDEITEQDELEVIHLRGARKFGVDWIAINSIVKESLELYGIDVMSNKLAYTKLCYRLMFWVRRGTP
jgi:hypothetical protein